MGARVRKKKDKKTFTRSQLMDEFWDSDMIHHPEREL